MVRSLDKPLGGGDNKFFWIVVLKGGHITCSIYRWSIHHLGVFLQDNMGEPYPGSILLDVEVWDALKDMINKGNKSFFCNFYW